MPPQIVNGGIDIFNKLIAPTDEPSPTFTPGKTTEPAPMTALTPISTSFVNTFLCEISTVGLPA